MEIIPCSRIGHLYRTSTYSFDGDKSLIIGRNNVRLVEVWMDEFKDRFYAANTGAFKIYNVAWMFSFQFFPQQL